MYQFISLTLSLILVLSSQAVSAAGTGPNNGQNPDETDEAKIAKRIANCKRPDNSPSYISDLPLLGTLTFTKRWGEWSVKPAASVQVIKYDLAAKQVSINKSLGAGASFHFYKNEDNLKFGNKQLTVHDIKPECRATTLSAKDVHEDLVNGKIAYSLFSITPTVYASEDQGKEFSVQPAILVGVFRDIFNFGVGFNLTGEEKGHTFLLFSMGASF